MAVVAAIAAPVVRVVFARGPEVTHRQATMRALLTTAVPPVLGVSVGTSHTVTPMLRLVLLDPCRYAVPSIAHGLRLAGEA